MSAAARRSSSVKPIVSDSGEIEQVPGSEALHVAVRFLDRDLPAEIGKEYEFEDLQFSRTRTQDPQLSVIPLASASGEIIGYFQWRPFRPGHNGARDHLAGARAGAFSSSSVLFELAGTLSWRRSTGLPPARPPCAPPGIA